VFIKRNVTRRGDHTYTCTLLVHGERVPVPRRRGRPAKADRPKTVVVHRTLANLSALPEPLIALIAHYCEAEREARPLDEVVGGGEPVIGPAYGPMAAMVALARQLGIERALGTDRRGRLALFLVLARIIHQGSRLSSTRWAETQAVDAVLGLAQFDEDDLYVTLDWLETQQERIENELAPKSSPGAIFLYDVTSSYLEGQKNELAASGYNRDGKRYKKQIVAGLLTDGTGEPVSVQVYEGNTSDPDTVADQVRKLAERFGAREAVLVGDRGMIKTKGRELLSKHGFRYVTSLTDPEIRKALAEGRLQMELFDEQVAEVTDVGGRRLVLRRNPAMMQRTRTRRQDQLRRVTEKVATRNEEVRGSRRADVQVSLRQAQKWIKTYHLGGFVRAELDAREVHIVIDEAARTESELLDGCYVVVTDVPIAAAGAQEIWDRYGGLQQVEGDFRMMKTGLLEMRPLYLRKANRTRAHALVTMLALKIVRDLRRRMAPLGLTCEDALDRLQAVRLVSLADPKLGLWRLPTQWVGPEREVLSALPGLPPPQVLSRQSADGAKRVSF
jgi:hypothetical protein